MTPRPAATVLLVRDGPDGVQVYLQRRPRRLGFAGGLWVFPGGRVDDADADPAVDAHWSGPPPDAWARRLNVTATLARGYVVAACREMFEEAGVLLARPAPPEHAVATVRGELLAGRRTLAQVLHDLGARLDTTRLRYWAWWVTPEGEPRRYDTRFFVAALPRGAAVRAHAGEVTDELWAGARELTAGLAMLPPTHYTSREVTGIATTTRVLATGEDRVVERVAPILDGDDILLPWGDRHRVRPHAPEQEA